MVRSEQVPDPIKTCDANLPMPRMSETAFAEKRDAPAGPRTACPEA